MPAGPSTLRELPSVHQLVSIVQGDFPQLPHAILAEEARLAIEKQRTDIKQRVGSENRNLESEYRTALHRWSARSLRHVVNATGVILHTNLGRAPQHSMRTIAGYSNLEYDLETGKRGRRDVHVGKLLATLLQAPAVVVNNGAAALFLALNELAAGGEAIISRGELIEIGDGFRIPDIMQKSGAVLREVGTTNCTTIDDYRQAITQNTRVLLRVHPSNFHITGFTKRPALTELVALGAQFSIPVYEDLGSGCLVDLAAYGINEPLVQDSLCAGATLVSFSGDKLLGGPQAGIIAGDTDLLQRIRRNPLFRALRQDKLFYESMETTLRHLVLQQWDAIPTLRMIRMSAEEVRHRSEALAPRLPILATIAAGRSLVGGGSTPDQSLPTFQIVLQAPDPVKLEQQLRAASTPVIARIAQERVVLDLRTVFPEEEDLLVQALS